MNVSVPAKTVALIPAVTAQAQDVDQNPAASYPRAFAAQQVVVRGVESGAVEVHHDVAGGVIEEAGKAQARG